ncbi:MAG: 2-hydroxyacyl-CoA dehydratase [bacterium]
MKFIEFTEEMKKTHKILIPNMLDIHFRILEKILTSYGYDVELLTNTDSSVIEEGLKYIHNDMCYPALLTAGQMIAALKSGKYDLSKVALIMSQTGGGCRASNYIHLIRKALINMGYDDVPVISFSTSSMEKHSGFKIDLSIMRRLIAAFVYGDLLMLLSNQLRPYENTKGETDTLVSKWIDDVATMFENDKGYTPKDLKKHLPTIVKEFSEVPITKVPKVKVGIVGEIYVKYAPLANNDLEKFLATQDCEVMVPGVLGFALYCIDVGVVDHALYGGTFGEKFKSKFAYNYLEKFETIFLDSLKGSKFTIPSPFKHLKELVEPVIGHGCKMGEGWFLTAEIMELCEHGYENVICTQPFGCLPNHIVGKGMIRKLVGLNPKANIVPIDYDPGATKVNQENRIKLMLAVAKENMENA